jgi:hypothetical protein
MRIALLGCGKVKAQRTCPAGEMYRSALFRSALRYALTTCERAYVLSAKHGLLELHQVIEPYELSLASLTREEREAWGRRVGEQLDAAVPELDAELVMLAGETYAAAIDLPREFYWEEPLRGMGIGERLAWLKANARVAA